MTARLTTALASAATLAALLVPGVAPAAGTTAPSTADPATTERAAARTRLTFTVADCEGCEVQLTNARSTLDADVVHTWQSRTREVEDGRVTFRIPTRRTWGMAVTVEAPWEGHTGYAATVAWRYNGMSVGDAITFEEAVTKRRASACWEGSRQRRVRIPLVVEEVEVDGVHERVPGTIAFAPTTQSWLPPMREVWDGVLGSQDVNICR